MTLSSKDAKSRTRGGKLRSTGTKAEVEAVISQARQSSGDVQQQLEVSRRELAEARAQLAESLQQQTATADVLKVISRSTFDLQLVLENLLESAVRLCGADRGLVYRHDGDVYRVAASYGHSPEWLDPFGTDNLGRDALVRIMYGARISLTVGFASTIISLLVGIIYGAVSGYYGGRIDNVLMRFVEVASAVPELLYLILLTQIFRPGLTTILVVIGATSWLGMARMVRGEVLTLKERDYVMAARTIGTGSLTIMLRHLIPNALGPILVTLTVGIPQAIFFESFLSFIGLGISAPMASWGVMASESLTALRSYPHLLFYPAAAIGVTLLAFQFLGQGMRDALDPRIKQ